MRLRREAAIIRRMQNRNTSFQNSSCTLCVPMFVESRRVVSDFFQTFTLVLQEEDLGNFEEGFEAVSPLYVYRIFISNPYGLYAMETVTRCRFRLLRSEIGFPE